MHNDHSLVLDKIEINQRKLSKYQLIVFDFHSLHIGNVEKLLSIFYFFLIKKSMCFISAILFKVRIERSSYQYFSLQFLQYKTQIIELKPRPALKYRVFFWSNLYKIKVMITSDIEMLEVPNFGHMTTSTIKFWFTW